jgi:D-alanyl-D-alanine carboxypeptidase
VLRRAFAYASAFAIILTVISAAADARGNRHAALILDANTGAILHNEDGDAPRHPASLTKMMTLYLTFETLQSGRLKMSDRLTISDAAASVAPSKLDLDPGDQITVADAIRVVITKSANDIAVALAERIGGSEANFARLMNARARELGMTGTHYENASGLPNDDQITTARDMATLALRLQDDFPQYFPMFATRVFSYGKKSFRNHNTMLNTMPGIDGIKTGYTRASGFNLVSSWHRGDRHLIGVVFGGDTAAERNAEMRSLLTRMVSRASSNKTRKPVLLARLKTEPKIAQRPAKRKPAIAVAEATREAPPERAVPPSVPETSPAPSQPDATDTPVQIFKVRAVPIVPKAARPAPSADETTDMEASDPQEQKPDQNAGEEPVGVAAAREPAPLRAFAPAGLSRSEVAPALPTARERNDEGSGSRVAMLGTSDGPSPTVTASIPRPVLAKPPHAKHATRKSATAVGAEMHAPPVMRGMPPSTLGAQARALGTTQPNFEPRRSAQRDAGGRYAVQIGAYGSIDDAQRALSNVQGRAGKLLTGASTVTNPTVKDGHQIFRARFTGLDAGRATSACNALRRQSVDCFVMAGD